MQRPRKPSNLSESLHRQLNSYALAASAAGVGVLSLLPPPESLLPVGLSLAGVVALSESADAKIVYTPTHENISCTETRSSHTFCKPKLNLTHGRRADFKFRFFPFHSQSFGINPVDKKNEIFWTNTSRSGGYAAALYKGATIQSAKNFRQGAPAMLGVGSGSSWGPWADVQNRYLGLKFYIKGRVHYGWARLSTAKHVHRDNPWATLTGYAYETIPNKPIIAGKTHGKDLVTLEPSSLGHLARGASAIPAWRTGK